MDADLRRENYAYVDKTRELKHLLDSGKYLFLARPRRFGKILMLLTIECMYQGHLPRLRHPNGNLIRPQSKVPDELLFAGPLVGFRRVQGPGGRTEPAASRSGLGSI